jgi:hypothetical protein
LASWLESTIENADDGERKTGKDTMKNIGASCLVDGKRRFLGLLLTSVFIATPGRSASAQPGFDRPVENRDTREVTGVKALLPRFTASRVPALGVDEHPVERNWPDPTSTPTLPGRGLAEHPMLYAGEGYNKLFLVNHGEVVWTYSTGGNAGSPSGEIGDVWMLSNGNILFSRQLGVEEVTPQKEIAWSYTAPPGTEIHSCQPIDLDKVLIVQNGLPPKLMILNKKSGMVELEHALPAESLTDPATVHTQFRRIRITATGTYLVPFLKLNKVVEYDKHFDEIWSYDIPTPWAAVRLHNGNTLITDEHGPLVREVNPKSETVWEFSQSDLPANIVLHHIQTADRLANGNTVIFSSTFSSTGAVKPADFPKIIQAIEVTPDKKLVWVLQDWKNLGPATTAQFLDQPGLPEHPGDLQR